MRILLDEDVYAATGRFLAGLNHDVTSVRDLGLSGQSDETILRSAMERQAVLITRDRDFGHLVFVKGLGSGVIYLRMLPSTMDAVHNQLKSVLERYSAAELERSFVVVEPAGHRFRRPLQC
jgi:predicted nuclease of predicted toxin-antitoxin system